MHNALPCRLAAEWPILSMQLGALNNNDRGACNPIYISRYRAKGIHYFQLLRRDIDTNRYSGYSITTRERGGRLDV